jgi:hypothetical protein
VKKLLSIAATFAFLTAIALATAQAGGGGGRGGGGGGGGGGHGGGHGFGGGASHGDRGFGGGRSVGRFSGFSRSHAHRTRLLRRGKAKRNEARDRVGHEDWYCTGHYAGYKNYCPYPRY